MIARVAACAGVVACGRVDFVARPPDAAIDAPPQVPGLVAMAGATAGSNTTAIDVPIAASIAGDLLVVLVADHKGAVVANVADAAGTPFVSAGARAVMAGTASELWYEADAPATSRVRVTMSPASDFDVWVAEFSGTRRGAPATTASACLEYPPTIVTAPGVTTVAHELVVSVTMLAFPLFVSDVHAPFTGFPPRTGNEAAFYVAPAPGSYGTTFDISSGAGMAAMTCASTAVWLPGP